MHNNPSSINRRDLLIHSAAVIATTSAVVSGEIQTGDAKENKAVSKQKQPIMVHHEWGLHSLFLHKPEPVRAPFHRSLRGQFFRLKVVGVNGETITKREVCNDVVA